MTEMNTLDRFEIVKINEEKEYKIQYTIRALIMLEKELDSKSILESLANMPFSFNDTFVYIKYGLMGGSGKTYKNQEAEDIMMEMMDVLNFAELQGIIISALAKSGAIGKMAAVKPTKKK